MPYNREKAITYAHEYAYRRNPSFYDFDKLGGDCTNFVSQCLFAGGAAMNYTKDIGWYYISPKDRAAAWTSAKHLHRFLTRNAGKGPRAKEALLNEACPGDVVQISFDVADFTHSLLVVSVGEVANFENILVAAHSRNADNKPLAEYTFADARLLHIEC